jgi:hypothetical protein
MCHNPIVDLIEFFKFVEMCQHLNPHFKEILGEIYAMKKCGETPIQDFFDKERSLLDQAHSEILQKHEYVESKAIDQYWKAVSQYNHYAQDKSHPLIIQLAILFYSVIRN